MKSALKCSSSESSSADILDDFDPIGPARSVRLSDLVTEGDAKLGVQRPGAP
jgi:hypothetical protein